MIEFNCPHCSHLIKAQTNAAGIRSKCPRCKANITVPMPEQSEPVFEEEFIIEGPKQSRLETWHKVLIGVGLVLFILIAPKLVYKNSGAVKEYEAAAEQSEQLNEEIRDQRDKEFNRKLGSESDHIQIGRAFTVDGIQYIVNSARFSSTAGDGPLAKDERPSGIFVIVDLSVKNAGKTADFIPRPKLKDEHDYEHEIHRSSFLINNRIAFEDINPGVSKRGRVVFDVPPGRDYRVVLYGSGLFAGNREVDLNLK